MVQSLASYCIGVFAFSALTISFTSWISIVKFAFILSSSLYVLPPLMASFTPDAEEEQKRKENLKQALQDPKAAQIGLTATWYHAADEAISNVQGTVFKVFLILLGYTVLLCFPFSIFTSAKLWAEDKWTYLLNNYSRETLYVGGTWGVFMLTYWIHGGIYTFIDFWRPQWLWQFKNQPDYRLNMDDFLKITKLVMVNCFIGLIGIYAQWLIGKHDMDDVFSPELPTHYDLIHTFAFGAVFSEVSFYFSHKWLHEHGWKYHKVHHEFKAPVAITSIYCHPYELIIGNFPVIIVPPFLINSHLLIFWAFIINVIITSQHGHCGYSFPLLGATQNHDYHHWFGYDNLGAIGLFDAYFGTNSNWLKSWQIKVSKTYYHPDFPVERILVQNNQNEAQCPQHDDDWVDVKKEA